MENRHYIIPIFVPQYGCPHSCVFCNQSSITGSHDKIDYSYVKSTVAKFLETMDKNNSTIEISFFGGTFTGIPIEYQKELLKAALEYKESGKIDFIRLSTRPDYINKEILDNLKAYKVDIIELGIQSMDDDVLKASGRGHNRLDSIKASNLIKSYGFILGHQIMPGLPKDTMEKDIKTCEESIKLKPDICRIYPTLIIKQTVLEKMYLDGSYIPYSLDKAVEISSLLYKMLKKNNIKIIRVGLQPTEEINIGKEIVAGPFHPAFRELVEGNLINKIIEDEINESSVNEINIKINSKDISKLYANKKHYFNNLKANNPNKTFQVKQNNSIQRGFININSNLKEY
ncbi:MAG: elongator complex protein 3 [Clostridiaceae bacterium]